MSCCSSHGPPRPRSRISLLLFAFLLVGLPSALLHSQTDHTLWFEVQDSMFIDLINDEVGDTTSPDLVWATYEFHMLYDSCRVVYTFTELKSGGLRVKLDNWKYKRFTKTLEPAALSALSRSQPFTVHTGDTVQFYRQLAWGNTFTHEQTVSNYYSKDDLGFVIRLKKTGTNAVLGLLDSLGVYSRIPSGPPYVYGTGPAMQVVKYVVPAALNGKEVYVDIGVSADGTGDYFPARLDDIGINLSAAITNPCFIPYYSQFNGNFSKAGLKELEGASGGSLLSTIVDPSSRSARIHVEEKMVRGKSLSLSIYRVDGTRVFVSSWRGGESGEHGELRHEFSESGSYVIGLFADGEMIASEKVNIQ